MLTLIVISFLISAIAVQLFMRRARRHARRYGSDMPQRFHKGHVPRLGGAGMLLGTGVAWLVAGLPSDPFNVAWPVKASGLALLCIAPAVLAGIVEDVTQRVSVRYRLGITIGSALLLCWLFKLGVSRTGVPPGRRLAAGLALRGDAVRGAGHRRPAACLQHHRRLQRAGRHGGRAGVPGHLARGAAGGRPASWRPW